MKKITLLLLITRGRLGECRSLLFYYFGNYEFPRIRYLGKCRSLWTQHLLSSPLLSSLLIKILVCPPVRLLLRHHFIIKRPPKSAKNSPKRGFIKKKLTLKHLLILELRNLSSMTKRHYIQV